MSNKPTCDFKDLANDIRNKKIVLPDFQRNYVWTDTEKQRSFVASILSRIPLGNIITFTDSVKSFACKRIGNKIKFNDDEIPNGKLKYLLDGQQRLTTLSMIFSNRLFIDENGQNILDKNLASKSLKKRFYLQLPKYNIDEVNCGDDLFGFLSFSFPFEKTPKFCSRDINSQNNIIIETFNKKNEKEWYHPSINVKRSTAEIVSGAEAKSAIPLFLLLDNQEIVSKIITRLAVNRKEFLTEHYSPEKNPNKFKILNEATNGQFEDESHEIFVDDLESLCDKWINDMINYLKIIISEMYINEINVDEEGKDRAIDIYEALNIGGEPLSTYDLIIAKASKRSKDLNEELINIVSTYYNEELLIKLNKVKNLRKPLDSWNAEDMLKAVKDNRLQKIIITQFLNLLSIVSNFGNGILDDNNKRLTPEYCREKRILSLTPDQICVNSSDVMKALMDSLMYLQFTQGIFSLDSISYNLSILPIAYAFYISEDKTNTLLLETLNAWYLTAMFTDFYKYDQSSKVIKHIIDMRSIIIDKKLPSYFSEKFEVEVKQRVLNVEKYNNSNTLLYLDEDNLPPNAVVKNILQFYLSRNNSICILTNNNETVPLNAVSLLQLHIHHFIPLFTNKKLGDKAREKTLRMRKDKIMINSVMNKVLITAEDNLKIGSLKPSDYKTEISNEFMAINNFDTLDLNKSDTDQLVDLEYLKESCERRFCKTQADIKIAISDSINKIKQNL